MNAPLLLAGREDRLREEIQSVRRPQLRRLLEECERYRDEMPPQEHPLASITYFGSHSANLALAYRLTGQKHYVTELRRWLAPAVSFPHWGKANLPDHDLDAGWLLHGLSLALSWAGDALPEDERKALEAKLILQGTRMHDFALAFAGTWWSSSYWQNHNWICWAGLATAGYVLTDHHPDATRWTEDAKENFDTVLDMLPEDGSSNEGVVYWRYGVPWLVSYLDVLKAAEGIDWFPRSEYLRNTFWYRLYQAAPDLERIVDHGDCHDRRSGHSVAMYRKLAAEYHIPQAQWLAQRVSEQFFWREAYESGIKPGVREEAYQELLWYDPTIPQGSPEDLPTSRYFPDLGLVAGRTSWQADAVLVSFKASPGGGHKAWSTSHRIRRERGWTTLNAGHHHPDAGSFVLLGHGGFLAIDEGYASRKRTDYHSTVLVDGSGFVNEGRYHIFEDLPEEYTAEILTTTLIEGWVHAVSETSAMYPRELGVERVRRNLVMTPSGVLVVVDDLRAAEPRSWTVLLQTDNPAAPLADGRWRADAGPARLIIDDLSHEEIESEVVATSVHANPSSSTPTLSIEKVQHTLRRFQRRTAAARFVTVLQPVPWTAEVGFRARASWLGDVVTVDIENELHTERVTLDLTGGSLSAGDGVAGIGFSGSTLDHGASGVTRRLAKLRPF